jgi:serine/threonine protein kinase
VWFQKVLSTARQRRDTRPSQRASCIAFKCSMPLPMTAVPTISSPHVQSMQHASRRTTLGLIRKMEHQTVGTAPAASSGTTGSAVPFEAAWLAKLIPDVNEHTSAARLIRRLLHPDPFRRPTVQQALDDDFLQP